MKKFTYSRMVTTQEGMETFTANEFDSFDEAKKAVDRGINDRKIELAEKYPGVDAGLAPGGIVQTPSTPSDTIEETTPHNEGDALTSGDTATLVPPPASGV